LPYKIICFLFSGFSFEKYSAKPKGLSGKRRRKDCEQRKCTILKSNVMNIIGRLTRDAEVRTLSNKKQVVNFSVATNDNYRNKQGERIEQTTYFDCTYWISPKVAEILTKGALVELSGRAYTSAWIGKDGEAHAGLNFHTSRIKFHGEGKKSDAIKTTSKSSIKSARAISEKSNSDKNVQEDDLPF